MHRIGSMDGRRADGMPRKGRVVAAFAVAAMLVGCTFDFQWAVVGVTRLDASEGAAPVRTELLRAGDRGKVLYPPREGGWGFGVQEMRAREWLTVADPEGLRFVEGVAYAMNSSPATSVWLVVRNDRDCALRLDLDEAAMAWRGGKGRGRPADLAVLLDGTLYTTADAKSRLAFGAYAAGWAQGSGAVRLEETRALAGGAAEWPGSTELAPGEVCCMLLVFDVVEVPRDLTLTLPVQTAAGAASHDYELLFRRGKRFGKLNPKEREAYSAGSGVGAPDVARDGKRGGQDSQD